MDQNAYNSVIAAIQSGAPVPVADPAELRRRWEAVAAARSEEGSNRPMGFEATADITAEQAVGITMRLLLLQSFYERGVLDKHLEDGAPNEKVFKSVASVPFDKPDLDTCLLLQVTDPPEQVRRSEPH